MKSKGYLVLKEHSGYAKGDIRVMHPNLAKMLAERGLVSLSKKHIEETPETPEPASTTVDNKGNVETTKAKGDKPKADDKPKSSDKGIIGKVADKITGKNKDKEDKKDDDPKPDDKKEGESEKKDDNIADDINEVLDKKE